MNCYCVLVDGSAAAILGRVRGPGRLRAPVKLGASGLPFRRPRTLRENTLPTVEKALVIAGGLATLTAIAFKWSVAGDTCTSTDVAVTFGDLLDTSIWSYAFIGGIGVAFGAGFVPGRFSLATEVAAVAAAGLSVIFLWGIATTPFEAFPGGSGAPVGISCSLNAAPGLWLAAGAVVLLIAAAGMRAARLRKSS